MKRLITAFILLSACSCFAQPNAVLRAAFAGEGVATAVPITYVVKQGFEGTGADNSETWSTGGTGTVNLDSTSPALEGLQSLRLTLGSGQSGYAFNTLIAGKTLLYGYCLIQFEALPSVNNGLITFRSAGADEFRVYFLTDGKVRVYNGTANATTTDAMSVGSTYSLWWYYKASTGSNNGEAWVEFSETTSKVGSGNKYAAIANNGTSATALTSLRLGTSLTTSTVDFSLDHVRIAEVAIGGAPQ